MARILLTHTPEARITYYGERALAGLRELGEVGLLALRHRLARRADGRMSPVSASTTRWRLRH